MATGIVCVAQLARLRQQPQARREPEEADLASQASSGASMEAVLSL